MGDRAQARRGRRAAGHLLSGVGGVLAALLQGPYDDGQRQLQRLASRGRLARQIASVAPTRLPFQGDNEGVRELSRERTSLDNRLPQEAESTEATQTCYARSDGSLRTGRLRSEARRSCWF